jgi:hypothetical protein
MPVNTNTTTTTTTTTIINVSYSLQLFRPKANQAHHFVIKGHDERPESCFNLPNSWKSKANGEKRPTRIGPSWKRIPVTHIPI